MFSANDVRLAMIVYIDSQLNSTRNRPKQKDMQTAFKAMNHHHTDSVHKKTVELPSPDVSYNLEGVVLGEENGTSATLTNMTDTEH